MIVSCGKGADKGSDSGGASTGACLVVATPDVPPAAGQIAFSVPSTVDPCSVEGYVVGYESQLKVQAVADGSFVINNVPAGQLDIIIKGDDSASGLWLDKKEKMRGVRIKKTKVLNGLKTDAGRVSLT